MKKDIGFWNEQGEYIPDIQEVSEVEMDKEFIDNPVIAYEELKQQNAKQKEMIERQWKLLEQCGVSAGGELKRVSYLLGELRAENARLKEDFRIESLTDKTTRETIYRSNLVNKYRQTLQEIKAIAKTGMHCEGMGCDFMPKILDLITKAEEE